MKDEASIKNANKLIKQIYSDILNSNSNITPEQILENTFDKYFIFENFFRQYFIKYKSKTKSAKQELINNLVDTIIYNEGNVTIEELVNITSSEFESNINRDFTTIDVESPSLTIQINNSFIELNDTMSEEETENKINEILKPYEEESEIEIKETRKERKENETKERKQKRFFFK